jgi:signal transduction histidine kinase
MIALVGWMTAVAFALALWESRRRLELVAEAAHELRGPVAAFAFAVASLRRETGGQRPALRFEAELERMRVGLADLDAARAGRRAPTQPDVVALDQLVDRAAAGWQGPIAGADRRVSVSWHAGQVQVRADRGRLAQALGNLIANAAEHGSGSIEVHAVRKGAHAVRVEVRDMGPVSRAERRRDARQSDRGRGLRIAERAVREAGGTLTLDSGRRGTVAAIELPVADRQGPR